MAFHPRRIRTLFIHGGVSGATASPPQLRLEPSAAAEHNALDAVEHSIQRLEEDSRLNAGFGAVLNQDGDLELDAGIFDGSSGRFGGVVSVQLKHPIVLARRVMEHTPHLLLSGSGAMKFARLQGLEPLSHTSEWQTRRWKRAVSLEGFNFGSPEAVDTVGAVGLDQHRNLAAGSSSGGIFGKLPGRVGDAAIPGAGVFANRWAAVVGTGVGEFFIEIDACRRVAMMIEKGVHPQSAADEVVGQLALRGAPAGILALDHRANVGAAYVGESWAIDGFGADLHLRKLANVPAGERGNSVHAKGERQ